jgi:fructose-bisphosphate aldolase, class II
MPLANGKAVLRAARAGGYAVGAFNADNLEFMQAVIQTAQEERAPVVVQIAPKTIKYIGLREVAGMVRLIAAQVDVPVVLHLDHGLGFEQNVQCICEGFGSLMFDGSRLPYEENVATTAKIAEVAHIVGLPVEAELGQVLQVGASPEEVAAAMTDPDLAADYVQRTGCDALAVAVGSIHQMRGREADLDIARIQAIYERVHTPLVLHGASGVKHECLQDAIEAGVTKINVATYIKEGYFTKARETLAAMPNEVDLRVLFAPAREAAKQRVREKMRVFGASNQITSSGAFRSPATAHQGVDLPKIER